MDHEARRRLIFALDTVGDGIDRTLEWVERLREHVGLFKVGKEAFTYYGPEIVSRIRGKKGNVFLDLKFHDIPNTVAMASEAAVKLGVAMFNLHAMGGKEMMEKAVQTVRRASLGTGLPPPIVLAVTVLTSLNDSDLSLLGFQMTTSDLAVKLSRIARDAGIDGVVASPRDIAAIRNVCGDDFAIVTPGIRSGEGIDRDDQKRVDSPRNAIRSGADYLVVGRPIKTAADPIQAADRIVEEISQGLKDRSGL
jgi:orotidine-5'-phosphate decarboxylase